MSAEDLFDGAIGIDLGTTYSYVLSILGHYHVLIHFFSLPAVLEFGKTTVLKSLPTTVCIV